MCSLCRPAPFRPRPEPADPGSALLWRQIAREAQAALDAEKRTTRELRAELIRLHRILDDGPALVDGDAWIDWTRGAKA